MKLIVKYRPRSANPPAARNGRRVRVGCYVRAANAAVGRVVAVVGSVLVFNVVSGPLPTVAGERHSAHADTVDVLTARCALAGKGASLA